jgi:hypothetical protein
MDGDLDRFIEELTTQEQAAKLGGEVITQRVASDSYEDE